MFDTLETLSQFAVLVVIVGATLYNPLQDDPHPVEEDVNELKELYARGVIDEEEHDRRLERVLDDRHRQIRAIVEDINNISDSRAKAIAAEYDSIEDLRQTDQERLEE